jgi:hypothetical protein
MAPSSTSFQLIRPFLYHLTASENLHSIRSTARLDSAANLIRRGKWLALLRQHRTKHEQVVVNGRTVWLRDQTPLHEANVAFMDGWQFADLVEALHRMVFFWPGTPSGPISYGRRHFERYRSQVPVLLRIATADLLNVNDGLEPLFCRYNSGSPRYSGGRASPRGPNTFVSASHFGCTAGDVVEVTFRNAVKLPSSTEFGLGPEGPWQALGFAPPHQE